MDKIFIYIIALFVDKPEATELIEKWFAIGYSASPTEACTWPIIVGQIANFLTRGCQMVKEKSNLQEVWNYVVVIIASLSQKFIKTV